MSWYYEGDGKRQGPVSGDELEQLRAAGTVTASTLVWTSGMSDWQPYREAVGAPAPPPPPPAIEPGSSPEPSLGLAPEARPDAAPGGAGDFASEPALELGDEPALELAPTPRPTPAEPAATAGASSCSQCGRSFSPVQLITLSGHQVCADCKPVFLQRMREGAVLPGKLEYAGFWIRFGARMIDGIILYAVSMIISMPFILLMAGAETSGDQPPDTLFALTGCLMPLLQLGVAVAYEAWFLGRFGATPGKMLCRLRVVLSDGTPISYLRGAGRHFATFVSGMILMIGYLMAAWDEQKRALHDHMCNTRVIRV